MTTSYTTLLGFALPQTGDLSGTWGAVVNASVTQLVEDSVAGVATASVASGDWTLTTTGSGADNQARKAILIPTGSSGTTRNINAPKSSKAYFVINSSTGSVVVRGGPTTPTTGVTITAGSQAIVAWNGSDFVNLTPLASGTVSSVGMTVPSFLSVTGSPVTGAGTLAVTLSGTALPVANGGTGVTTSTGSGNVVLSTSPTLVTPILGTPTSGTLSSCTVDGTNKVGYLKIPANGDYNFSAYTLVAGDSGKYVPLASGGSIIVNNGVFSQGDAVTIFNNTSSGKTLTMNITTAYIGGTDTVKSSITLAARGIATILFIANNFCVVTGNVS